MIINKIFSKRQSFITYPISELIQMCKNGQLEIRETNPLQVRRIKKYLFSNAATKEIYLPPIVATLSNEELGELMPKFMRIADGSHRLKAFLQLEDQIFRSMKSEADEEVRNAYHLQNMLENTEIAIQLLEGLTRQEEDQLYIDLNTKGKQVALSKRIEFDSRNTLNQITNRILQSNKELRIAGVEKEKRAIIRPANKKLLSLSQLRLIVGIFLSGKLISRAEEWKGEFTLCEDEYIQLINLLFQKLFSYYPPEKIGNYEESMLASFPLLLSIILYATKNLENEPFASREKAMIKRMDAIMNIDWSRQNLVWKQFDGAIKGTYKYYYLANNKANIERIVQWLENEGR